MARSSPFEIAIHTYVVMSNLRVQRKRWILSYSNPGLGVPTCQAVSDVTDLTDWGCVSVIVQGLCDVYYL